MRSKDTGPRAGAKGAVEGVKGSIKESAAALVGDDQLRDEGRVQREKGAAQREVAAKEVAALKARGEAKIHEAHQRSHQA